MVCHWHIYFQFIIVWSEFISNICLQIWQSQGFHHLSLTHFLLIYDHMKVICNALENCSHPLPSLPAPNILHHSPLPSQLQNYRLQIYLQSRGGSGLLEGWKIEGGGQKMCVIAQEKKTLNCFSIRSTNCWMTAKRDEEWHGLIWVHATRISQERLLIMLRHSDGQVAPAHHRHNEEIGLLADSSAGGKITQRKQSILWLRRRADETWWGQGDESQPDLTNLGLPFNSIRDNNNHTKKTLVCSGEYVTDHRSAEQIIKLDFALQRICNTRTRTLWYHPTTDSAAMRRGHRSQVRMRQCRTRRTPDARQEI